ncbi:uncharacterized protein LOC129912022 [Episyrphus balteatus]|uniref:uncharacterized protein LOC129912022 n=1 Tax=Episyrphus balteatus TaxID=286459 RepID=UPI0024851C7C|nr:uncharacterized protein LOC129912022 [Episyrphus balteatus]
MEHHWIHSTPDSPIPPFAVLGGYDADGSSIYVGRAFHEGDNLPAKVVPNKRCAYVSWGGREITKTHYEILVGEDYRFISCPIDTIPQNAVRAGNTVDGEPLYVGRGMWEGSETVGKIHPTHHCLYIPFGGDEQRLESYEVLIREPSHVWVPGTLHHVPPNAVVAGHDTNKSTIYVGRAYHEGENLPAKFVPDAGSVYVSHDGHDIFKDEFEVLVGDGYSWVGGVHSGNNIPIGAVSTGHTRNGEKVYVGRGYHHGSLTPGKVHPGEYRLYIAYGGKEVKIKDYEMLVKRN